MKPREVPDLTTAEGRRTAADELLRRGRAYKDRALAGLQGDERAWIQGAQAGSLSDLEALFREHWPRVYRAAYLIVQDGAAAEDITQESFLAALRALHRFDGRHPFGPWLHRTVVNRAIDWAGSRALRAEVGDGPLAAVSEKDREERPFFPPVVAALATLTPEQRAVIVLRHLLEYSTAEIAAMLELPRRTVSTTLRHGVDELGDLLEGER
jgi:RNA polymerase sigma-70 factor, ECF subfamily